MTPVLPGQILAGKYRVDRVLGVGGMGVVVAATHLHLEERVAIKFLLPDALQNGEAVARFGREARAAVKIRGEHVARVIDVGSLETGAPYMVMEYLDGHDLAGLIHSQGAMPPQDAVDAVLQACEALAEAHALGIVHRDLKPANLFMTRRPDGTASIKVLDFGISKLTNASASDHSMTKTSAVMGSPLYMSPEQMTASRDVDARTDIWAIGVVLYELLSGRVPFNAETLPQICGLILTASAPDIRHFAPNVPEGLQAVVQRCLEKDRTRRFNDVSELARALAPFGTRATSRSVERIARILGSPSADIAPASAPQAQPVNFERSTQSTQSTQSNWGQTNPARSSAAPLIAAALAAVTLVAGGIGFFVLRGKALPDEHAAGAPSALANANAQPPDAPVASSVAADTSAISPPASASPASASPAPAVTQPAPDPHAKPSALHASSAGFAANAKPASHATPAPAAAPAPAAPTPVAAPAPKPKKSAEDLLNGRN
ncbi:MAG TPA: serine/threonine-protein kinase [Polyangiaceae bacterium]